MYACHRDASVVEKKYIDHINGEDFQDLGFRYIPDDEQDESIFSKIITQMKNQYVLMVSSTRKSIVKAERLEKAAENLFSCRNFDELKIPLIITSTDLISGKPLIYSAGSVLDAVVKSSSIPGFIEPSYKDGSCLLYTSDAADE